MQERNLLLVDDEKSILIALKRDFINEGYNLFFADNGQDALNILKKKNIQVILTDIKMPGMDGIEFLHKSKKVQSGCIHIALSAYTDVSRILDSINKGNVWRFITKPWDDDHLLIVVKQAFEHYELKESEERLNSVIQKSRDGILVLDINRKIKFTNPACEVLFNQKSNELIGSDFSFPISKSKTAIDIVQPNNKKIVTEMHTVETTWDNKNAYLVTLSDMTDREMVNQKYVDEQFKRYEFIVNASGDFMTLIRRDYTYVAANRSYCKAHNKIAKDIIGKKVIDIWGEEAFNQTIKPLIDKCLIGKKVYYHNWFKFGPLGNRYMEVNYFPYYDLNNNITHCAVVTHDITELKKKEEEIRKARDELEIRVKERTKKLEETNISLKQEIKQREEAELEIKNAHLQINQLLSSIKSIIIGLSIKGNIIHWNPIAEKCFTIKSKDAMGKLLQNCKISWGCKIIKEGIKECFKKKEPVRLEEIRYINSEGKNRILGLNLNPIFDNKKSLTGYIIWGADITDRKSLESQLSQAQKLEAIGQLAAGIAHEINTPTQYIGDNTQFIKDSVNDLSNYIKKTNVIVKAANEQAFESTKISELTDLQKKIDIDYLLEEIPNAINETLEGVKRVTKIVRSMKEFSHPGVEEKTAIDINKAIESTITISRNEWKYVADIETDFNQSLPLVPCLPGELNQVILNLIVNAAHAIGDVMGKEGNGKGKIFISTKKNEGMVEIRIKDTGIGIPKEILDKIFEPFFTTKEVGKGTGQGLFIAHSVIVEKLSGKLSCETEVGKSTTFIIQLPI